MKKKKIIIACFLVVIVIGIILLILFLASRGVKKDEFLDNLDYKYDNVDNCIDPKDDLCVASGGYAIYTFKSDNPDMQKLMKEMNAKNQKLKKEDLKHTTADDEACAEVKGKYKYRYLTKTLTEYLEYKNDVISISQNNIRSDFCSDDVQNTVDIYIYSKKKKKFLTEPDELFEAFGYLKEQIDEIIVKNAKKRENKDIEASQITGYQLTYNHLTQVIILYQLDGNDEWFFAYNDV
ncbi:MAG: hypothetical protein IKF71_04310 [Bacilli bacterium]|nr:hypothetical protein [Bacilli bacterium]